MKLANQENNDLRMCDLKDGDVAVIQNNITRPDYAGRVILAFKDGGKMRAVWLGNSRTSLWRVMEQNLLPVRKLESGEMLVIE